MAAPCLDPSVWNLPRRATPWPLLGALGCGPVVPQSDTEAEGSGITLEPSDDAAPSSSAAVTTVGPQCEGPGDCPPGYDCVAGRCVGGCDEVACCYDTCCGFECGWYYECVTNADCGVGYVCEYDHCSTIEAELECDRIELGFAIPIPVVDGVSSLAFAELDGDAPRELVVGGTTTIAIADVDGTVTTIAAGTAVTDLAVADLDLDGDVDVVFAGNDGSASVHTLLDAGGSWVAAPLQGLPAVSRVAVGDFEGDGMPDVVGFGEGDSAYAWFGHAGGFDPPVYVWESAVAFVPADLDLNGMLDAVLHSDDSYAVADGLVFGTPLYSGVVAPRRALAAGNFNADGLADVLGFESIAGTTVVTMWPSSVLTGGGWMHAWWNTPIDVVATADLDGDGFSDVVAGGIATNVLAVGFGADEPAPDLLACVDLGVVSLGVAHLAVGDFSGDGRPDVAISDGGALAVQVQS
ncbi:MAG: VCBS repeat-containing protein [Nannocystaceae bacterium]|nr:VCBS repeat-containing protein [Nannocystaceae bacterium]